MNGEAKGDGRSIVSAPPVRSVLETVLYSTDQVSAEHFYAQVLGFRLIGKEPGRHLFFRAGSSVLLVFDPRATNVEPGAMPAHGSAGRGHVCFLASADEYDRWREYISAQRVPIVHESRWGDDQRSFYFRDPAGNLLEIANSDFWRP